MRSSSCSLLAFALVFFAPGLALATTYQVGPGKPYAEISAVTRLLKPGDIVEVQGDHTYAPVEFRYDANGTAAAPIVIRGVRVNGKRPVVSGGANTVLMGGNFYTFEGFEVAGGSQICVVHKGNGVVLRDLVVHGCARHGILGTDSDSGSLTMEYVEVYDAGSERGGEALKHPVYIATDERRYPGSVFRMQHCYVHDANGGNSVKSRAERNEIYQNWLEGAQYYELELIGPDDGDVLRAPREDADVVGNVFLQTRSVSYVTRIGGDGSGRTGGRYRFVNNTFVIGAASTAVGAVRVSYSVEALEMYNNVIHRPSGPIEYVLRETELTWVSGRQVRGSNNWLSTRASNVPPEWTGTISGTDPGFTNLAMKDVRPTATSPLVDKGTDLTARTDGFAFLRPQPLPPFTPPVRALPAVGAASPRAKVGVIDIGAYEFGSATPEPGDPDAGTPGAPDSGTPGTPGTPGIPGLPGLPGTPDGDGGSGGSDTPSGSGGCACIAAGAEPEAPLLVGALAFLLVAPLARRRGRRP